MTLRQRIKCDVGHITDQSVLLLRIAFNVGIQYNFNATSAVMTR